MINHPSPFDNCIAATIYGRVGYDANNDYACDNTISTTNFRGPDRHGY